MTAAAPVPPIPAHPARSAAGQEQAVCQVGEPAKWLYAMGSALMLIGLVLTIQ